MPPRLKQLGEWEKELVAEQEQIARELEPLLNRREEIRTKLDLLARLKGLEGASGRGPQQSRPQTVASLSRAAPTIGSELQSVVKEILKACGRAMHLKELRTALAERGVPLPGRGTDANLIVHLRRARDVFRRQSRGTYGLVEWSEQMNDKTR